MRKYLFVIAVGAVLMAGCKSKNDPTPASSNSYFPVTSGSTWTYNDVAGGNTNTLTITMTGATSVINGKTYYVASSNSSVRGTSTGDYYAANHDYAIRATNAAAGVTVELQLGDDSKAVGYSWTTSPTDNGTVSGFPARTVNTVKEVNVTKTVNGKSFTNVIHTQVALQYDLGSGFQNTAVYDIYLAKGVGMIELDTSINGSASETETITSYTVK
ncbi:MAG TPA: hypothetical protein VGM63_20080 [Mucilaginibacter sp.]|jgi:hypothetical protein